MKRIVSNLRPADQKPQRNIKNVIVYTDGEKPSNDYPQAVAIAKDGRSILVGTARGVVLVFEVTGDEHPSEPR